MIDLKAPVISAVSPALNSTQTGAGSVRVEIYDQQGLEAVHLIGVSANAANA